MSEHKEFLLAVMQAEALLQEQEALRKKKREEKQLAAQESGTLKPAAPTKEETKAQRDRVLRLSRALVGIAELGDEAAFDNALSQGADLNKAIASGQSALMAALDAGQSAMAAKILSFGKLAFPGAQRRRTSPAASALSHDDLENLQRIHASLPKEIETYRSDYSGANGLLESAWSRLSAPRCALWMLNNASALGLKTAPAMKANPMGYPLFGAMNAGKWELAEEIAALCLPEWERQLVESRPEKSPAISKKGHRYQSSQENGLMQFLHYLLHQDNPKSLLFLMRQRPSLFASLASMPISMLGTGEMRMSMDSAIRSASGPTVNSPLPPQAQEMSERSAACGSAHKPTNMLMPLISLAAGRGASNIALVLSGIPLFADEVKKSQEHPERYFWEEGYCGLRSEKAAQALTNCGFDFGMKTAGGVGALHLLLGSGTALTKQSMELIGKKHPELLSETDSMGLNAFSYALKTLDAYSHPHIHQAQALMNKVAIAKVAKPSKPSANRANKGNRL